MDGGFSMANMATVSALHVGVWDKQFAATSAFAAAFTYGAQ
jgi:hypothetical protein